MKPVIIHLILQMAFVASLSATESAEFQARRKDLMRQVPEGIVLLHARSDSFSRAQLGVSGFLQDSAFYYFTGLDQTSSAILAIDGVTKESWLFVPIKLSGVAGQLHHTFVIPGSESATSLGIEHVLPWDNFISYIDQRIAARPNIVLYVDSEGSWFFGNEAESNPPGLEPIGDSHVLWRRALERRWPNAKIDSVSDVIYSMELQKSPKEVETLRRAGKISAAAAISAIRAIRPGQTQRVIEAEVIRQCIRGGGEGPSFWPWIMSGESGNLPLLLEAGTDYRHFNRRMKAGELAHVDIGCEVDHYSNDVGRTVPVSGHFNPGQREVWALLTRSFQAGLASIHEGAVRDDVLAAAEHELQQLRPGLKTGMGRKAFAELVDPKEKGHWLLHGAGVECCQRPLISEVLHRDMVIVLEVSLSVDDQGFYLEDMVLVTPKGHEVLTADLPYSAATLESLVGTR